MIKSLGRNGGVIMINFGTDFLDGEISKNRDEMREKLNARLGELGLVFRDEEAKPHIEVHPMSGC